MQDVKIYSKSDLFEMWCAEIAHLRSGALSDNHADLTIKIAAELRAMYAVVMALPEPKKVVEEPVLAVTPDEVSHEHATRRWVALFPRSSEPESVEQWLRKAPPCYAAVSVAGVGIFITVSGGALWKQEGTSGGVPVEALSKMRRAINPIPFPSERL